MSLELPDFVGPARHTEASAFDFLWKEEKQNKTKVSIYHWTQHRKACTMAPKLPGFGKLSQPRKRGPQIQQRPLVFLEKAALPGDIHREVDGSVAL